ncbi:MAG: L-rhamnose isomerase [Akkermansiaceae bacterium]|nr:L-rhamnose isomerase [Akkermansiaceae bacterium]MBJ7396190.1 L-rhamnose isomerase [Akkermansiaceae bacterium]
MNTINSYTLAREQYAQCGIDTDAAIAQALAIPISLHCWQTDDNVGFEAQSGISGGGILATGNYPGRARDGDEVRADLAKSISLIPGVQRVNVHSYYADFSDGYVNRDQLEPKHFQQWMDWAKGLGISLDFNPSFHAHPKANDGFTLSHQDASIREFWIEHGKRARKIAEAMAESQGTPCNNNFWIPDGAKDLVADSWSPRARLIESYDAIFADKSVDESKCVDFVESKLFGIGSEEYVVGSSEFYSNYTLSRNVGLCMDMGHYHPTETIHGKISSQLLFRQKKLLLHVSRPIRWDSDHVVIFNDDLKNVFLEIQRGNAWDKMVLALDFFDASINRIAAYVIGTRATRKAILYALLDPSAMLKQYEDAGKNSQRLAVMEEFKTMPFGAVWTQLCEQAGVPAGTDWLAEMEAYETANPRC